MIDRCGAVGGNRYDPTGPVFISYRQSDGTELAQRLDRFLRAGGLVPWRDLVDLPPGETARRVHEAFEEGIAAAVLIVTPEIQKSQFVPAEELPELLKLEQEPHDFSLLVLNTIIPTQGETASNDGWSQEEGADAGPPSPDDAPAGHPLGGCGRTEKDIDFFSEPDRLLKTTVQPLKNLKQYGLGEFRQLYRDLLHRRLGHLMRPAERYLPSGLPTGVAAVISSAVGWMSSDRGIGDGEITIQTQTRPVPDAHTRRSGATRLGREHDLAIRLRQDPTTGIPAAEDYRHLKETLPIMVDALYAHGVSGVTLTGGGHFSLGWALGTALPITRQGGLRVIDLQGHEWTDASRSDDQETFHAIAEEPTGSTPEDPGRLRRVAVLIRNQDGQNQQPFDDLKATCDESFEIIIKGSSGERYPSNEGARLAKEIAKALREHGAGRELHIAWSAAVSLAPLVARRTNTLNCVLYELTQNPLATKQRYQKVLRVAAGMPHGPIVEVFDDLASSAESFTRFVNLTPHAVRLYRDGEVVMEWPAPADDQWVRVDQERRPESAACHDGLDVPVTTIVPSSLVNEPPEVPGTGYIVSRLSAQASGRRDYFFPLDEVRDAAGNVLGVTGLGQFPQKN